VLGPGFAVAHINRLTRLRDAGRVTTARILKAYITYGKAKHCFLRVSFDLDGTHVSGDREVIGPFFGEYRNRPVVPVTTAPGDPTDFEVGPVDENFIKRETLSSSLLVLVAMFYSGGFLIGIERRARKDLKLMRYGVATKATVVSSKLHKGKPKTLRLTYSYESSFGQREGIYVGYGELRKFGAGTEMIVLYQKDNDRKSKPLDLFTWTYMI
jgi:hypothetical protein